MDRFRTTLTALAAPRRAFPTALVALSLVAVQVYYTRDLRSILVPLGLVLSFVLVGPWSWRALVREGRMPIVGGAIYAGLAVALVGLCGVALPGAIGLDLTFLTDPGSLVVATILYLVGGAGLGRDITLEADLEHSRLHAVRTHFDPHFLYNTLNAIAEWCAEDPKVAEEATLRLASLLREVLEGLERPLWPLERETAVTLDLLELHRVRDLEAFDVSLELDDGAAGALVPPLLLLSLAENAVKHGPRKGHRGPIAVRTSSRGDAIRLEIENPGPLRPGGGESRGLAMLRKRLSLSYGRRAHLAIAEIADRTRATIELPRRIA
jgi:two-component system, LytTR family, sensor histidine kinase AlgZ